MLKVLMASSEGTPFIKTGGLADVIGSLPKALIKKGVDVRIIMPLYSGIPPKLREKLTFKKNIYVYVGIKREYSGIFECNVDGVTYYFIDNEYYFKRDGLYGFADDGERFAYFDRAVLEALPEIGFCPDIIHCHDWQAGMVPVLLSAQYRENDFYKNIKTLFTIHNLKFQGIFPKCILGDLFGLGDEYFTSDKLEFYGNVSFMKGGLVYSNIVNTVSPTYSYEIQNSYFGERMDGLLRARNHELYGILNGIDYDEYNPENDKCLYSNFNPEKIEGKRENKLKLQEELGLNISPDVPLIGLISRLTPQKGLDLIECVFDEIMSTKAQLVVLGTGDKVYEDLFKFAESRYGGRVSSNIRFDNSLAHRIYGGADMFLMPSQFEPCGLGQIIALRYGTLPIVRETGGLKDTVTPYNEFTGEGNGFSFANYNAHDMLYTIKRAVGLYSDKSIWGSIVENAMACDYSWNTSAQKYIDIYEKLTK
jgi:glycogen/starch synthases, ADP-glucose type